MIEEYLYSYSIHHYFENHWANITPYTWISILLEIHIQNLSNLFLLGFVLDTFCEIYCILPFPTFKDYSWFCAIIHFHHHFYSHSMMSSMTNSSWFQISLEHRFICYRYLFQVYPRPERYTLKNWIFGSWHLSDRHELLGDASSSALGCVMLFGLFFWRAESF